MADIAPILARQTEEMMARFIESDARAELEMRRTFESKRLECITSMRQIKSGDQNELKRVVDLQKKRLVRECHSAGIDTTGAIALLAAAFIKKQCDEMEEELLGMDGSVFEDEVKYGQYISLVIEWWHDTCDKSATGVREQIEEMDRNVVKKLNELDALYEITHMMAELSLSEDDYRKKIDSDQESRQEAIDAAIKKKDEIFKEAYARNVETNTRIIKKIVDMSPSVLKKRIETGEADGI